MGFNFSESDDPKNSALLCICIVLILVLFSQLSKQEYSTCSHTARMSACAGGGNAAGNVASVDQMPSVVKNCSIEHMSNYTKTLDRRAAARKKPDPEREVMYEHTMGKALDDMQQKKDDPLSLDGLLQTDHLETTDKQLGRSFGIGNTDGPELEGMSAPIDQFEKNAMRRQLNKRQEIYGDQTYEPSEADILSELNL